MTIQIIIVLLLTFIIHLISTLSYSVRIVGTRTRKIAVSFALFNIMVLISRTSNSFQAPLLAKWVENNINLNINPGTYEIRLILFVATLATIFGAFLIPTFQRILSKAVMNFSVHKSMPKLILHSFTKTGIKQLRKEISIPNRENLSINSKTKFPLKIFIFNILAVAILSVGVLSSLYAGFITPELRTTASSLSAIVNGFATILMFVIIDPYLSILTDEVVEGKFAESEFRRTIRYMVFARVIGTILAQLLLVPFAHFIALVAEII
ncbi:lipid II flippase Amj family protein [Maribacter antarcticus]|uniref:lipid II flippase Amj family protein n=1 Tax=Maribacter antarcticus TaxID=505250 RepID=UPI00047BE4D3|nr:lipid II flippase Amj family protein [Maribacter antarcticus]